MSPPPYSDLGKKAKDVFNKGYHFGLVKLDVKTKSASGVEFATGGVSNQESGKVSGSLETKYKVKDYGLTFTEKWTTDNTLSTEFAVQDQFVPGLKVSSAVNFAPQTGAKSGNVKVAYVNKQVALNADSDFTADGPKVTASAVVGYQGWLAGYLAGYDVNNKKLTKSNFALGFTSGDFTLHSNVELMGEEGQEYGGSIYQRLNPKLEYGIMVDWVNGGGGGGEGGDGGDEGGSDKKEKKEGEEGGEGNAKIAVGLQYQLDPDASVRIKVDNEMQIGLGFQQRLREGISIWLSALVDGKNVDQGGKHKVGLAIEMEA
ncbi:voltage-dependent anion-selective channel-like isoform X3 [Anthonomus grandis grandis]|nr:voltage-dependent anion-selective channel-like isoform X3 [Anthonomus grandis grandis]